MKRLIAETKSAVHSVARRALYERALHWRTCRQAAVRVLGVATTLAVLAVCGASPLHADITPDLVKVSTPIYRPQLDQFEPVMGTYTYDVHWQGIPAATATMQVVRQGESYRLVAKAKTARAIDLFYKLRYHAEGLISMFDLLPSRTVISQRENSKIKDTEIAYLSDGEILSIRRQSDWKEAQIVRFNPENQTLEPFSAAFLARSLDWTPGQVRQFDTFNGKTRYLITLEAIDEVMMNVNGEPRRVWVISPKVENLTAKRLSKLRDARIYVTADRYREVLKIVSEVFIGSVTAELVSFTPEARPTVLARLDQPQPTNQRIH